MRSKRKKITAPDQLTAAEAAVVNHLLANGWEPGWISRPVIEKVLRLEQEKQHKATTVWNPAQAHSSWTTKTV